MDSPTVRWRIFDSLVREGKETVELGQPYVTTQKQLVGVTKSDPNRVGKNLTDLAGEFFLTYMAPREDNRVFLFHFRKGDLAIEYPDIFHDKFSSEAFNTVITALTLLSERLGEEPLSYQAVANRVAALSRSIPSLPKWQRPVIEQFVFQTVSFLRDRGENSPILPVANSPFAKDQRTQIIVTPEQWQTFNSLIFAFKEPKNRLSSADHIEIAKRRAEGILSPTHVPLLLGKAVQKAQEASVRRAAREAAKEPEVSALISNPLNAWEAIVEAIAKNQNGLAVISCLRGESTEVEKVVDARKGRLINRIVEQPGAVVDDSQGVFFSSDSEQFATFKPSGWNEADIAGLHYAQQSFVNGGMSIYIYSVPRSERVIYLLDTSKININLDSHLDLFTTARGQALRVSSQVEEVITGALVGKGVPSAREVVDSMVEEGRIG